MDERLAGALDASWTRGREAQLRRVALHELLSGSDELRNLIQHRAKTTEMQSLAAKEGMITLLQDGILKILAGLTTYEQVRAVAMK